MQQGMVKHHVQRNSPQNDIQTQKMNGSKKAHLFVLSQEPRHLP